MNCFRSIATAAAAISVCVTIPTLASAQATGDGWQGPRVFSDAVLNQSLVALNEFLSDRYAHDDLMAALSTPPEKDFETTAVLVADVPQYRTGDSIGGFTGSINGGSALDLHLAAFNDDLSTTGDSLFIQIARASGGVDIDMREAGGMPPVSGEILSFGPTVDGDMSLDYQLDVLSEHIVEQAVRENQLSGDGAVTGHSFDLYSAALRLF